MKTINLKKIEALYSNDIKEYGPTPKGVGWKDVESQSLRFDMLLRVVGDELVAGPTMTFNELGCGYGALIPILRKRLDSRLGLYRGYDISDVALQKAAELYAAPDVKLKRQNKITEAADYSLTSGIFNVKFDADEDDWRDFIEETLDNLAEMSRIGFAFNMLTDLVDFRRDHLYYADPGYFFDLCRRRYSRRVSLLHEYPLYEFTILVWK